MRVLINYFVVFRPKLLNLEPLKVSQRHKRYNKDSSLVSNKNLSEILPSSSLGPGPDQTRKRGSCRQDIMCDKEIFRHDTSDKTLARDIHV